MGRLTEYDVVEELGRGTFGTVYKGFDRRLQRHVAIKVLNPQYAATPGDRKRFEREARAVSKLDHDHVVRVYDVCETSQFPLPFLVMELIDGESLAEQLANRLAEGLGPFKPRQAAQIVWQVATALAAAHQHGLVHRDIKSSNIMLERHTGRAKLADFGLACEIVAPSQWSTRSGKIIGTLPYMSPEQLLTADRVDARSDIYSLGVVLYELLTGERPFRGTSPALLVQVAHDEPESPRKLNSDVPRDLETICLKCLAKEPHRRFGSAADLADELQRLMAGEPIRARPVPCWERLGKWAKRQPKVAALLAVVVFVTVLGFAGTVWQWSLAEARLHQARIARRSAEHARDGVRALNEQMARNLYFHRVGLAHREWLTNNLSRADQLLEECPAEHRGWEWHYLKRLFHPETRTLRGHALTVRRVACSPDGRFIASAGGNWNKPDPGSVVVWDARNGEPLQRFVARSGAYHAVAFSPDSRRLATANAVEGMTVWNLVTGRAEFTPIGRGQFDVKFSPTGKQLAGGGADGIVRIWDANTGALLRALPGHVGDVFGVAFRPDARWLASIGADRTCRIWNTENGRPVHVLEGTGGRCVAFSPDGMSLASCGYDGAGIGVVRLWDLESDPKVVFTQRVATGPVTCLCFSPDGRFLALNNVRDGAVRLWEAATGRERQILHAHTEAEGVAFSPDGRTLVTGGNDRLVKLWDMTRPRRVITREDRAYVPSLAFHPAGAQLAVAGGYNTGSPRRGAPTVQIWDVTQAPHARLERVLAGHDDWLTGVAYGDDGRLLASADRAGVIRIWDTSNGKPLQTIEAGRDAVTSIAFRPDGRRLAAGLVDAVAELWDAGTGERIQSLHGHQGRVLQVAYSPDGRFLASASDDHTAKLWDATAGRALYTLRAHDDAVKGIAFDHGGRLLATCGRDGRVNLWKLPPARQENRALRRNPIANPSLLRTLRGHTGPVSAVAFSKDDTRLASIGDDATVKLWDVATGQEAITLTPVGGGFAPFPIAFSAGGSLLAAARGHEVTLFDTSGRAPQDVVARDQAARRRAVAWHQEQSAGCERVQNWFAARFHLCQLIALAPEEPTYYLRRGNVDANGAPGEDGAALRERSLADYREAVRLSGSLLFTGRGDHLMAAHVPFDRYEGFTIEAWIYGGFQGTILSQGKSGDPENGIRFRAAGDSYWESGSGQDHRVSLAQALPLQWNHVAWVCDGVSQRLFVNGQLLQQHQAPKPGPLSRERMLMIGGHESKTRNRYGSGLLKSIRISQWPIYDADFTPNESLLADADTVLLYDFSKNRDWLTTLTVPDLSGSGNDGALIGAWWKSESKRPVQP